MNSRIDSILRAHSLISEQVSKNDIKVVLGELNRALEQNVAGDIAEFGCYAGTTSLFIRRLLDEKGESDNRAFHAYDSFEGLPEKTRQDESVAGDQFKAGELAVSKKEFLRQFHAANLRAPVVHKAWFSDLTEKDVPEKIAFAFLDGDFYDSIMDTLKLVWPRLSKGGAVLVDDYGREALPGAERAVRDFFGGNPPVVKVQNNIAIMRRS